MDSRIRAWLVSILASLMIGVVLYLTGAPGWAILGFMLVSFYIHRLGDLVGR